MVSKIPRKEKMVVAENSCQKRGMGGIGFSSDTNLWLQQRQTWKLIRISLKGKRIGKN